MLFSGDILSPFTSHSSLPVSATSYLFSAQGLSVSSSILFSAHVFASYFTRKTIRRQLSQFPPLGTPLLESALLCSPCLLFAGNWPHCFQRPDPVSFPCSAPVFHSLLSSSPFSGFLLPWYYSI